MGGYSSCWAALSAFIAGRGRQDKNGSGGGNKAAPFCLNDDGSELREVLQIDKLFPVMAASADGILLSGVGDDHRRLDAVAQTDQPIRKAGFAVETLDLISQVM